MADPEPDADERARHTAQVAQQIAADPQLRARYFENAGEVIAEAVPSARPFGIGVDKETKNLRRQVLAKIPKAMKEEAASSFSADAVIKQFFKEAIRNPELTFKFILGFSVAAFAVGVALVVAGLAIASVGDDNTQNTIIATVFGGMGVTGALGSVYTLTRRGVSEANTDHARIRLVLWGFATEVGHLRSLHKDNDDSMVVIGLNKEIAAAVTRAVELIRTPVKMESTGAMPESDGSVGVPSGTEAERDTDS